MASYPNNKKDDPAEFEDVYAGPGMMDEIGRGIAPEEEDPATEKGSEEDRVPEFECVYAGPDYFGEEEQDIEIEEPEEPEKKQDIPPEAFARIFDDRSNKPPVAPPPPPPEQFMAVYAGPQYMMAYAGPQMNNGGAFAPVPQPQPEMKKKCELCGAEMPLSAKFCGKCGSKFKELKFCPGCGHPVVEGSKFCSECGTVLK